MKENAQKPQEPARAFFCYAVGIEPAEGAGRDAIVRLRELLGRSRWLVRLRWLAVAALAGACAAGRYVFGLVLPLAILGSIAAAVLAYNFIFHRLTRRGLSARDVESDLKRAHILATLQMVADLVTLAVILHFTGGVENPFFFYFVFHMIIGSMLLSRPASLYIATLAVGLFFALVLGEYSGLVGHYRLWNLPLALHEDPAYVFSVLAVFATTMYLSAYFAGDIVERLRTRGRELASVTASLEKGALQLHEAYEKIRLLEEKKSDFLRIAAHQLRAPMAAIRSLLDVVLEGFAKDGAAQREMLQRAHDRADLMLLIVNDVLALSRLKEAVEPEAATGEKVGICAIMAEVEALYRPKAQAKNLRLEVSPPPAACSAIASADDVRQILTNLVDNALNYTPQGGSVTCSAKPARGKIVIEISDTGIGVPPEEIDRIFEEFYRAPNAKMAHSFGTGLGLAIVKRTVEKWLGSVRVESRPGKGTTFTVEFPAAHAAPDSPRAA